MENRQYIINVQGFDIKYIPDSQSSGIAKGITSGLHGGLRPEGPARFRPVPPGRAVAKLGVRPQE